MFVYLFVSFLFFCFLGPHLWCVEVSSLGVQLELQLAAYGTITSMPDPIHIFNLHHSLWQYWFQTHWVRPGTKPPILLDTSQIHFHCPTWILVIDPCDFTHTHTHRVIFHMLSQINLPHIFISLYSKWMMIRGLREGSCGVIIGTQGWKISTAHLVARGPRPPSAVEGCVLGSFYHSAIPLPGSAILCQTFSWLSFAKGNII